MRSRIWRRCSREGSMIWERWRREEPETGFGRSLFTPLPRHASVLDYACQRGQRECTYISTAEQLARVSVAGMHMHSTTYRGDEKSDEDTDEQRSCRRQLSAQRQRYHGFHRGSAGGGRDLWKSEQPTGEGEELEGDGRSGGGRGGARGRERGGGGKSARMCGRRGKAKGTTRCNISTCSSASEQPRNLFPRLLPPLR